MIRDDLSAQLNYIIIDDFEQMRVSFKGMLSSFGAEHVTVCGSGEAALKSLASESYDVVICDYNLGEGRDGQQVLEEARHLGYLGHASIFFMVTAESSLPMVLGALEQQPDEYMVKPINQEALHRRLKSAIQRKQQLKTIDIALAQEDIDSAIKHCVEQRGSDLKQSLYLAKLQAELYQEMNQYENAVAIYRELLTIRDFNWAKFGLGKVAFYQGDYHQSEEAFQGLIEKNRHFLEAYDWLAMTLESEGKLIEAQEALSHALHLSPKSVARQRRLGLLAMKNGDQKTTKQALQAAIRWGENSCFATAEEYRLLAEIYLESGEHTKMVQLLVDGRKRFSSRPADTIQMLCGLAVAKHAQGRAEDVESYLNEVEKLAFNHKQDLTCNVLLKTAKDCFRVSGEEQARRFCRLILCNKHDDEHWIDRVRQAMNSHIETSETEMLISESQKHLNQVHIRSMKLLRHGDHQQAIGLLNETVDQFPYNKTMVLLAAKVMIACMAKQGLDNRYHFRCRYSLAVLSSERKQDPDVIKLLEALNKIAI
jgi:DNA-binding response OmpR family regulator